MKIDLKQVRKCGHMVQRIEMGTVFPLPMKLAESGKLRPNVFRNMKLRKTGSELMLKE